MRFGETKGKGKDTQFRGMNESIENEMNIIFVWNLEGNSSSRAEGACYVGRLHKITDFFLLKMNTVFSPSEPSSSVHKVSRKQK